MYNGRRGLPVVAPGKKEAHTHTHLQLRIRKITSTLQLHYSNCFELIRIRITSRLHYSNCFEVIT